MIEAKLASLGYTLPLAFRYPSPNRTGCIQAGSLVFVSGHPPMAQGGVFPSGKVGGEVTEVEAYQHARSASFSILSSVRQLLGSLDRVRRVIKVTGMVNSAPGFNRQFAVVDGASDLFFEIWGPEFGCHTRTAVGVFALPRDFPLEIEAILEAHP